MSDMGTVRDEIMRLFADRARYGLFAEVGRHVGVSGQAVSEWARGETIPTEEHWPKLESYFGLKPGQLGSGGRRPRGVAAVNPTTAPSAIVAPVVEQLELLRTELAGLAARVARLEQSAAGPAPVPPAPVRPASRRRRP